MKIYFDWIFYSSVYLGTLIDEKDVPRLAQRASRELDLLTFGRAEPIVDTGTDTDTIEKIRLATCAIADEMTHQDDKEIQSESVGGHSVSYVITEERTRSRQAHLADTARVYLHDTGLLYRGLYADERQRNLI